MPPKRSRVKKYTIQNTNIQLKCKFLLRYLFACDLSFTFCDSDTVAFLIISTAVTHTHTHPFNGPLSGTTRVSQYQKGKTNLDFSEARDSEWQWHRLDHMQVCTSLQTDNHANTSLLSFLQAGCPSCRPTNSAKAHTAG